MRCLSKIAFVLALGFPLVAFAQELTPTVRFVTRDDYPGDNRNWSVACSPDRVLYFGNSSGLLSYDGGHWMCLPLPQGKAVRSVYCEGDRVYVGGYEEFGYFRCDRRGTVSYTSLYDRLEDYRPQNNEVWRIFRDGDRIIFKAFNLCFVYEDEAVKACPVTSLMYFLGPFGGRLLSQTISQGVAWADLDSGTFQSVAGPFRSELVAHLPLEDKRALLVTARDGLFHFDGTHFERFHTDIDRELERWQLSCALRDSLGNIYLGTRQHGVAAISPSGALLWKTEHSDVLRGSEVVGMGWDWQGNIWLALDKGLAMLGNQIPLRVVSSIEPPVGGILSMAYVPPFLYMGTGRGLYRGILRENTASLDAVSAVLGVQDAVLDLMVADGQLFCGTAGLTYEVFGDKALPVSGVQGGTCMAQGIIHGQEVLLQGTYTHLCVYVRFGGHWRYSHTVNDFIEPLHGIDIDYRGTIWASHLHKGLFAIRLQDDLKTIAAQAYFPSLDGENEFPIRTALVNGRIIMTDKTGHYTYDDLNHKLVPYVFPGLVSKGSWQGILPAGPNDWWFVTEDEAIHGRFRGDSLSVGERVPFRLLGGGMEDGLPCIVALPDGSSLFNLQNAISMYVPAAEPARSGSTVPLEIARVHVTDKSFLVDSLLDLTARSTRLPHRLNYLVFSLRYPDYDCRQSVSFETRLEGHDRVWIDAASFPDVTYRYLPPGTYRFLARALSSSGEVLAETDWPFVIRSPWYASFFAKCLYAGLVLLSFFLMWRMLTRQNKRRLEEKERDYRAEMQRLRQERQEEEIRAKSRDMAAVTIHLVHKNDALNKIKKEIALQKKEMGEAYPDKYYRRLCDIIDDNIRSEEDWTLFEQNFDRFNGYFFNDLKQRYPTLTANDLRFCAYLRMNLTSKEIAALMGVTLKGVESARSRIRKKIQLPKNQDLTGFFIQLGQG